MKKHFLIVALLTFFAVGFISVNAKATFTVATFADPSGDSNNPLFTVDFIQMTLNGEWSDAKTGLTLQIPYSGNTFIDAWFEMSEVEITDAYMTFGETGSGEINFYEDGNSTSPLVVIGFESGVVSRYNFGADEIFIAENVTITGSEIAGTLSEEQFAFSFANLAKLPGSDDWNDGFTATAAFTSSAVPEPATICLLGLGALSLIRRKKTINKINEIVKGKTQMKKLMAICLCVLLFLVSSAAAYEVNVYTLTNPIQDDWSVTGWVDELGNKPPFPDNEWITSSWEYTNLTACSEAPGDEPDIQNVLVQITNMTSRDWSRLVYVGDANTVTGIPETTFSNWDEWVGQVGAPFSGLAFMIDNAGVNKPLVYESIAYDDIFQAGEIWKFIIQDYANIYLGPASALDSLGIACVSTGYPPSTGSIIAIPEPATICLLGLGTLSMLKRRKQ